LSKTESWKTWTVIIALLIVFGLITVIVPGMIDSVQLSSGGGSGGGLRAAEVGDIVIPPITNPITGDVIEIEPIDPALALVVLTAVTVGLVVGTGVAITLLYTFISKLVVRTNDSDAFKDKQQVLANKEKEQLKTLQTGRKAASAPEVVGMPRWSVLSTSLIILLFVLFGSLVLTISFFPERLVSINNELVNPALIVAGIPLLIGLACLLFYPRWGAAFLAMTVMFLSGCTAYYVLDIAGLLATLSVTNTILLIGLVELITLVLVAYFVPRRTAVEFTEKMEAKHKENNPIPYDSIAVLLSGLIILGLGLGLMVLINSPYIQEIRNLFGL
jgi:hypothetical protein